MRTFHIFFKFHSKRTKMRRGVLFALLTAFFGLSMFGTYYTYRRVIVTTSSPKMETKCMHTPLGPCRRENNALRYLYPDFNFRNTNIRKDKDVLKNKFVVHEKADATIENVDAGHCVAEGTTTRCFPLFLIIGIQKSGTTALTRWLSKHPSLRLADGHIGSIGLKGEAHFFDAIRRDDTMNGKSKYLNYENVIGVPIEESWKEYIKRERFVVDESDVGTLYSFIKRISPLLSRAQKSHNSQQHQEKSFFLTRHLRT